MPPRPTLTLPTRSKFSGKEMGGFEAGVDRVVQMLVDLIERRYVSAGADHRPIEFGHRAQYFALDVIGEVAFGAAPGFLREDRDMHRYVEMNDAFVPVLIVMCNMPRLAGAFQYWPLNLLVPKETDGAGFGVLTKWVLPPPQCPRTKDCND